MTKNDLTFDECLAMAQDFLTTKERSCFYQFTALDDNFDREYCCYNELSADDIARLRTLKDHYGDTFVRHLDEVFSDPDLVKFGVTKKVTDILDAAKVKYSLYSDIKPNPTIQNVKNGVKAFKAAKADCIVAIGGGSSMDTAKAVGIIIANPKFADVRSLEGVAPTKNPSKPILAVPTTAGTAAEVTINYVITDVEKKRKFVCVDPHDIPVVAFVDPDRTTSPWSRSSIPR